MHSAPNEVSNLLERRPKLMGTTRDKLMAAVDDSELRSIVNELYRPGAKIGDGGTAAMLVEEFNNGLSKHLKKATQRLNQLNNLKNSKNLGLNAWDIVDALKSDLQYAVDLFR